MAQDQDDDLENDVESSDASGDLAANSMPPAMTSSMKMPQAPPTGPINPMLQDYLKNKQAMADAQKQASDNEMITGLARAGASLSAGLAHSSKPVDEKPFDAMAAVDQAPVTNILSAQKSQAADLSNQGAAIDAQRKFNSTDPNSAESMAVKAQIKRLYGDKIDSTALDTMSAADLGEYILKPLELNQKITEHKDEMASRAADRAALFSSKKQDKQDADHEKYIGHIEDSEKSWRSDPASQRFDAQLAAAQAGKTMIDRYRGHEDDMPIQDVHALVSDRLKAITGATPTEQEIAAQMPSSMRGGAMHPLDTLTGQLHPAEVGDFVRNIDTGFREMEKTARAGLIHRQQTVANSPRLSQEERERLVKIGVPDRAYSDDVASDSPAPDQDHASRAAAILAKRQAAKTAGGASSDFAYGGIVQPPGFQHVHQPMAQRMPAPKPLVVPKMPVARMAPGMKPMATPETFAQGGVVPGKPPFQHNDPRNDIVKANLTPQEIVLPLSVTQSKDVPMAAYLYTKHVLGKK